MFISLGATVFHEDASRLMSDMLGEVNLTLVPECILFEVLGEVVVLFRGGFGIGSWVRELVIDLESESDSKRLEETDTWCRYPFLELIESGGLKGNVKTFSLFGT